jgi:sporulation protein YlmC with PRC-barrel domain
MKIKYGKALPLMAGAACITLATLLTVKADDPATTSSTGTGTYRSTDRTTTTTTATTEGVPAKFNKASGLIGMDVRNQSGEQLGHIKDIVIDLKSEKVSYAVMSTAPKALLGINEKLLAVPLTAFTVSSDEKHLVLNADKAKVEAAAGFDKNNWPAVNNPTWGAEPFWQKSAEGTITPGTSSTTPRSDTSR